MTPGEEDDRRGTRAARATLDSPRVDAEVLLAMWERGRTDPPARRAVTLLDAAWPLPADGSWLDETVGCRDACLLTLQEELFGRELEAVVECLACGERLEVGLRTDDIRVDQPGDTRDVHVAVTGYEVRGRLPTSADLLDAIAQRSDAGSDSLLALCIDVARRGDTDVDPAVLPEAVAQAVIEAMADGDPQADVQLALRCPTCGNAWSAPFDIVTYLWDEVDDWARRVLGEVHVLASAYGWSEHDVLAMSAERRRLYTETARADW